LSKAFFNLLARSRFLATLASRYGMRKPASFARRFVAGESIEEAIDVARRVESQGLTHTLDYLGENARTVADADAATVEYRHIIEKVIEAGIGRNLSLKLTQLGLDAGRASAIDNLRRILDRANGFFVRIDMESSRYTEATLEIFETLWHYGYHQIGVVLQADLFRTEQDLQRILALGARVRLVKGAYQEPSSIAYGKKADVDANYARLMQLLLDRGTYPAIATHDPEMIDVARRYALAHQIGADRFEFQMLYGIRRDLQSALVRDGYRVRVYIPFGRQWFPYFMRRLGERPANLSFVIRGILREKD